MEMGSRGNGRSEVAGLVQHSLTTDEEIVVRVRAGDTELFEVLMRRHNQRLYCAVRAILESDAEAEDVVQQTYLAAYRHLGQFEGRARFGTWLTRIAIHEALARRRSMGRHRRTTNHEFIDNVPAPDPDPEQQAYAVELNSALSRLPATYRAVFVLREIYGFDTLDTAERLRLTEGTVRTRLHRAKDFLQRALQEVTPAAAFRFDGARCDRLVHSVLGRLEDVESRITMAAPLTAISETRPDRPSEHP